MEQQEFELIKDQLGSLSKQHDFKEFYKQCRGLLADYIDWEMVENAMSLDCVGGLTTMFDELAKEDNRQEIRPVPVKIKEKTEAFNESLQSYAREKDYQAMMHFVLAILLMDIVDFYQIKLKPREMMKMDYVGFLVDKIIGLVDDLDVVLCLCILVHLTAGEISTQIDKLSGYYLNRYMALFLGVFWECESLVHGDCHGDLETRDGATWQDGRLIEFKSDGRLLCPDCGMVLDGI